MIEAKSDKYILDLLERSDNHQQAFAEIMSRYSEPLYWHVRRLVVSHEDAQDVLQEALVKAYRNIDSFERRSSLKTWLYRIATNEAIRYLQSTTKAAEQATSSYDDKNRLLEMFEAEQGVNFETTEAALQRAILSLPERQRVVFNLRYYDELSYQHIAEITESSVATLKTNYHYATEKIKKYMLNQIEN